MALAPSCSAVDAKRARSSARAISASGLTAFTEATGQILREVTANSFPTRAKGLAQEILKKKPDLVGLQEVALWRTGPPSLEVFLNSGATPTATDIPGRTRPSILRISRATASGIESTRGASKLWATRLHFGRGNDRPPSTMLNSRSMVIP